MSLPRMVKRCLLFLLVIEGMTTGSSHAISRKAHRMFQGVVETVLATTPHGEDVQYYLRLASGTQLRLVNVHTPPSTRHVKVQGRKDRNSLIVDSLVELTAQDTNQTPGAIIRPFDPAENFGSQRVAIVRVDHDGIPCGVSETAARTMFDTLVAPYYLAQSRDQLQLEADILGPVDLSGKNICDLYTAATAVIAALDPVVDWRQYQFLTLATDFYGICGFGGHAYLGKISLPTADGIVRLGVSNNIAHANENERFAEVVMHEIGHNTGQHHAGLLWGVPAGPSLPADWQATADILEYGDLHSNMGASQSQGLSPTMLRTWAGWIPETQVPVVTEDSTITIRALELENELPVGIRILRGTNQNATLWIDAKGPWGFDTRILTRTCAAAFSGALLYIPDIIAGGSWAAGKSVLLDTTPGTGNNSSCVADLQVGQTFLEGTTGAEITLDARTPTTATLTVKSGQPDLTPPEVVFIAPTPPEGHVLHDLQLVDPPQIDIAIISATATDPNLARLKVGEVPYVYPGPPVAPVVRPSTTTSYEFDPREHPRGATYVTVEAFDGAGNRGWVRRQFIVSKDDYVPPSACWIESPANGAILPTRFTVDAAGNDDRGLYTVQIWVDGTYFASFYNRPDFALPITLAVGPHTLQADCIDFSYNHTLSSTISVVVGTGVTTTSSTTTPSTTSTSTTRPPTTSSTTATTTSTIVSTTTTQPCCHCWPPRSKHCRALCGTQVNCGIK